MTATKSQLKTVLLETVAQRDNAYRAHAEGVRAVVAMRAQLDEAVALLRDDTRWLRHDPGCPASYSNVCSCGLGNYKSARYAFLSRLDSKAVKS